MEEREIEEIKQRLDQLELAIEAFAKEFATLQTLVLHVANGEGYVEIDRENGNVKILQIKKSKSGIITL